jgi:hypothetical protein
VTEMGEFVCRCVKKAQNPEEKSRILRFVCFTERTYQKGTQKPSKHHSKRMRERAQKGCTFRAAKSPPIRVFRAFESALKGPLCVLRRRVAVSSCIPELRLEENGGGESKKHVFLRQQRRQRGKQADFFRENRKNEFLPKAPNF